MAAQQSQHQQIRGFLKKFKAAPVEEISVATALDVDTTRHLLNQLADEGLVELRPSKKYPSEEIAVGTAKLLGSDA
jgi:DNA-binding IclR family transcriptional regulator